MFWLQNILANLVLNGLLIKQLSCISRKLQCTVNCIGYLDSKRLMDTIEANAPLEPNNWKSTA